MARLARKSLADMRAMEEQNARVTMRGRGAIVGAGATPSMGLSQFRGGGNEESSSDEDECKCKMCGGAVRILPARGAPPGYSVSVLPDVPTNALIRAPTRPPPRGPPRAPPPRDALVNLGPSGRPPAYPSMPRSYYEGLYANRPIPAKPTGKPSLLTASQKANIAKLLAAGIPLAALGAYLGDALAQKAQESGLYDDYIDVDGLGGEMDGLVAPEGPAEPSVTSRPGRKPDVIYDGTPPKAPKLTKKEINFYLQSGNLPDRFYSGLQQKAAIRQGSGKSDGRSARAEVVRKVMREKGMKLIEASKYVKANGLYKK